MTACRVCKRTDCDDDCEELALIYRREQREKLRDINVDEIECDVCGRTYGEASHDGCVDHTTLFQNDYEDESEYYEDESFASIQSWCN